MGKRYLIDTNTLIDAQMNKIPESGLLFLENVINDEFLISFITKIEFLGYKNATESTEEFIKLAHVIEVNQNIINLCIAIRKNHNLKIPDSLIAATALDLDAILVTNNTKDFAKISDLEILSLYSN